MTPKRLAEIEARLQAARPGDRRPDGNELNMFATKRGYNGAKNAQLWHADGDGCANILGNLGYDVDGDALAEFFAHALVDVRDLIKAVKDLTPVAKNTEQVK